MRKKKIGKVQSLHKVLESILIFWDKRIAECSLCAENQLDPYSLFYTTPAYDRQADTGPQHIPCCAYESGSKKWYKLASPTIKKNWVTRLRDINYYWSDRCSQASLATSNWAGNESIYSTYPESIRGMRRPRRPRRPRPSSKQKLEDCAPKSLHWALPAGPLQISRGNENCTSIQDRRTDGRTDSNHPPPDNANIRHRHCKELPPPQIKYYAVYYHVIRSISFILYPKSQLWTKIYSCYFSLTKNTSAME